MYKEKYLKYKIKYHALRDTLNKFKTKSLTSIEYKNQYGGNIKELIFPFWSMTTSRAFDSMSMEQLYKIIMKKDVNIEFLNKYFCKYKGEPRPENLLVYHTIKNETIGDIIYKLKDFDNIDESIIFASKVDIDSYTIYINNYIKFVIDKYNTHLYISLAPVTLEEFYLPSFIQEYLDINPDECFTILIIGSGYDMSCTGFKICPSEINTFINKFNSKYNERIKFIHIYTLFLFPSELLNMILENNYKNQKINIFYDGTQACGLISSRMMSNNKYLHIGCDGFKYKEISTLCRAAYGVSPQDSLSVLDMNSVKFHFDPRCIIKLVEVNDYLLDMKKMK